MEWHCLRDSGLGWVTKQSRNEPMIPDRKAVSTEDACTIDRGKEAEPRIESMKGGSRCLWTRGNTEGGSRTRKAHDDTSYGGLPLTLILALCIRSD